MANILVVDDESLIAPLLIECLQRFGHTVKGARSAVGALGWLDVEQFDVAILDVMMPGPMNGLAVCQRIRSDPRLAGMRVLVTSGVPNMEPSALEAGADAFLPKPFDLMEIVACISKFQEMNRRSMSPRPGLSVRDAITLYTS
jgi:DNA-binding response OmpR family regulator